MKVDEMERLLAAYYEGITDEHEEERLKEAFRKEKIPAYLEADRRVVLGLRDEGEKDVPVPAGLEEKLSRMIDRKDAEEPHFLQRNRTRRNWRWAAGVAATFLLLFGIGWGVVRLEKKPVPPTPMDTFADPQEAYRALQATLVEMSDTWRAGMEQVEAVQADMNVVREEIKQELSK